MSGEAREWVWESSESKGTARLVLLSISDRVADEQCVAFASVASLVKRTNASRTAVREALDRLLAGDELEELVDLEGPQRSTVYRLPLAAKALSQGETVADAPPADEAVPERPLHLTALRRYGIRPRNGTDSAPSPRTPARTDSAPSRRNPTPRRIGFRPPEGTDSDPQNRSEPKVNRRNSSSTAVTTAGEWQIDPASHTWALQEGHLARLGEHGLQAADEKWRAHRATWSRRSADAWAADWRAWVARERSGRPNLYALPGSGDRPAAAGRMTRAEAHTAALLAALEEPTGTE
ncbi:helix-turn-helix domain-containing protein [Streptomyces sp. NPDC000961]|uniref:helix-turn-helix domain-containing protein n=1 Tax=Streptomyces TaxID=1883 RepID=UPI003693173C